jgi:ribosomal protein S18 acetylase RimI-like enzyme
VDVRTCLKLGCWLAESLASPIPSASQRWKCWAPPRENSRYGLSTPSTRRRSSTYNPTYPASIGETTSGFQNGWIFSEVGLVRAAMTEIEYSLRSAKEPDASKVATLVDAAYGHYVERIGILPRPMTDDYAEVIANQRVTVAESHGTIVGVIVLAVEDEGFLVDNVAVDPSLRGKGLGRALLEFAEAEARRAGFDSIYLYTHEKMTENLALYSRIGYVEYDRRSKGGFSLVYMRKPLR